MINRLIAVSFILSCPLAALRAQDSVTFRDRAARDGSAKTVRGKIESESIAGIRLNGVTVPAGDVIEVVYEAPTVVRLDLPKAVAAEAGQKYDEAIKEYRALIAAAAAPNQAALRRHFEFKIALASAAKAEGGETLRSGVEALEKFIHEFPEAWQRVPATRTLVRLHLDRSPPDAAGAWRVLDAVVNLPAAPSEVKAEFALAAVDIALREKNWAEARRRLSAVPPGDARLPLYQTVAAFDPTRPDETIQKLTQAAEAGDEALRPVAYNLLGDLYRNDPKKQKEALFAYLWVDVVYNRDPVELAKAQDRLADLFKEMNDEPRARHYRDKARRK